MTGHSDVNPAVCPICTAEFIEGETPLVFYNVHPLIPRGTAVHGTCCQFLLQNMMGELASYLAHAYPKMKRPDPGKLF